MTSYTVIKRPSMVIVGIECRTSNAADAGPKDIPQHWGRFYSENIAGKVPNKASDEVIALYCDYESDYTKPYSLVIGCPVTSLDKIPEGMVAKTIPASSYALFRAVGEHPKPLIETWGHIWQTELNRSYSGDYEVYGKRFLQSPQEVEVFVALASSKSC